MLRDTTLTAITINGQPADGNRVAAVYRCKLQFDQLRDTDSPDVKFCEQCKQKVFRVTDFDGFERLLRLRDVCGGLSTSATPRVRTGRATSWGGRCWSTTKPRQVAVGRVEQARPLPAYSCLSSGEGCVAEHPEPLAQRRWVRRSSSWMPQRIVSGGQTGSRSRRAGLGHCQRHRSRRLVPRWTPIRRRSDSAAVSADRDRQLLLPGAHSAKRCRQRRDPGSQLRRARRWNSEDGGHRETGRQALPHRRSR